MHGTIVTRTLGDAPILPLWRPRGFCKNDATKTRGGARGSTGTAARACPRTSITRMTRLKPRPELV
eukprot:1723372-Lingulodinium_polyedra.AAC.1